MNARTLVYGDGGPRRAFSLLLFCAWTLLVLVLAWNHAVWRDEVRAYSLVIQGNNFIAFLRSLHGDSNSSLWYILIRLGHALLPRPQVLQIVAYLIAFTSMLLLVFRSPFSSLSLVLLLFSRFAVYEYSVVARNYGISMLLLFLLALVYPRHRDRGLLLGSLLFLLANCNVHSVLLVGAFLVFWLLDLLWNTPTPRRQVLRNYILNAAIAIVGIVLCAATIYPPINDAATIAHPHGIALLAYLFNSLLHASESFGNLLHIQPLHLLLQHFSLLHQPYLKIPGAIMSLLLFGSTLGLVRRPAALLASWLALSGFVSFFAVVYPGGYRHEALWLVFLITLYWIAGRDHRHDATAAAAKTTPVLHLLQSSGYVAFILLLALQTVAGLLAIAPLLLHKAPEGRARDLGRLIDAHANLRNAIVVADPDYLVETVPYYVSNPTYLLREHRFGNIVHFTRKATLNLSLDDILSQAQQLHAATGKHVLILLQDRLDPARPPQVIPEAYDWTLSTTPDQVRRFQASTCLLKSFGSVSNRASNNDETYDVYVLK